MKLTGLFCARYRKFKESLKIDLAPISIVIGKNGSGKSVISRLPLLLAKSLSATPEGVLDIEAGGVQHASRLQDLVNGGGALPFTLGAEFSEGEHIYSFETTLRYVHELRLLAIESFTHTVDGRINYSAEIVDSEQLTNVDAIFKIRREGVEEVREILAFSGLLPIVEELKHQLDKYRQAVGVPSYLGPFRVEPGQILRFPGREIQSLGARGERALEMLADDELRRGGVLNKKVADWFAVCMGSGIGMDVSGDRPTVHVNDQSAGIKVALSDTGAGFSQCLPIVVQHMAYQLEKIDSPILIVEQPELHLHPAAHGALADLFVASAEKGATCIVETHSEELIMRLRRRIAEGGMDCRDVKILSVDHLEGEGGVPEPLRTIELDQNGNPNGWPFGVFEESLSDLRKLRMARRAHPE